MSLLKATALPLSSLSTVPFAATSKPSPLAKTILLAEDNDDLREVMSFSLLALGYEVVACADGDVAAEAFHTRAPVDLLFTDFNMPGRTGLELARELTALQPALPVLVLTGTCLSAGMVAEISDRRWAYVSKPCHMSAVARVLERLLAGISRGPG